jgi:hypothetical protein
MNKATLQDIKKNSVKGRVIGLSALSGCGRLNRLHIDVG